MALPTINTWRTWRATANGLEALGERRRRRKTMKVLPDAHPGIFTSLPLRSLDKLTLQNKLKEIGRS
jgi:hypothetical protein